MKEEFKIKNISIQEKEYPQILKEIKNPPPQIFFKGFLPGKEDICIAIVGTRKPTEQGKELAKRISFELAKRGFIIVSGLAFGIDAEAHKGALMAKGKTIAVLANGLDMVYPLYHTKLAIEILTSGGGIISEYPEKEKPLPYRFLERNRIISGLSIATIVIEAPKKSGSLATAHFASEQGRDVFVFPGDINNKNYEGSHFLIRNGARLVSGIYDILDDLKPTLENYDFTLPFTAEQKEVLDEAEMLILETLKKEKMTSLDKLLEITHLELQELNEKLLYLTIENKIEETNGLFKIKKI